MKLRNLKRFASLVVSLVMVFALAVPGFAQSTDIGGYYEDMEMDIEITDEGEVIVNPFGLPYTVYQKEDGSDVIAAGEQITNPAPMTMVNRAPVDMSVVATVIGTINEGNNDLEFATDLNAGTKAKKMVVNYEVFQTGLVEEDLENDEKLYDELSKLKDKDPMAFVLVTATSSSTTEGDIILGKGVKSGEEYQAVKGGIAMFRLSGSVTKNPVAGKEWNEEDTFNVSVAYTFEPYAPEEVTSEITGTFNVNPVAATAEISLSDLPVSASNIKWRSSNVDAVTVEDNGSNADTLKAVITYVGEGKSTITVTFTGSDGAQYQASVEVEGTTYVVVADALVEASPAALAADGASAGKIIVSLGSVSPSEVTTSGIKVEATNANTGAARGEVSIGAIVYDATDGTITVDVNGVTPGDVAVVVSFKTRGVNKQEYKATAIITVYNDDE